MFSLHLALHEPQIRRASRILRQAVQRQLQQFADAHSAFLKNENHLHPRSLQVTEMPVELVQDGGRNITRLRLGRLRHFFVVNHSLRSDGQPPLACCYFQEGSNIDDISLAHGDANPFGEVAQIFQQQFARDGLGCGFWPLLREELGEARQ